MKNENEEIEIENKHSLFDKINEFNDSINNDENNGSNNNYLTIKTNKSRNIKKGPKNNKENSKKNKTNIHEKTNKKNNIFIFRTTEEKSKSNLSNILNEEITIITNKYISVSCDKIKRRKNLLKELIPIKNDKKHKKSYDFTQIINIKDKIDKKQLYNLSRKEIPNTEINGNTEITTTIHVRKISNSSENLINNEFNSKKNDTNINHILNLHVENNIMNLIEQIEDLQIKDYENKKLIERNNYSQYQQESILKKIQLDSIEEVFEEENDSKTKSKNNTDRNNEIYNSNGINYEDYNKYSKNFSNEKERKSYNTIDNTGFSTKFGTGKNNNNIFDISSDEEDNNDKNIVINYIENNNIENENEYKTNTDCEHDTENNFFLNPIKPNENENSISFMNASDINKLFCSPSKKGINNIYDNNNLTINNINYNNNNLTKQIEKLNNSALNKRTDSFDEFIINIPHISNNFKQKDKNNNYYNNNKNTTYKKKKVTKSFKNNSNNIKNLIIPNNLNNSPNSNNKIKEIKLSLNKKKCIKIFSEDNQKIQKLNKNIFRLDENEINTLNAIKNIKYIKTFEIPKVNIKPLSISLFMDLDKIENKSNNNVKENISYSNKKNYSSDSSIKNDVGNISTVMTTFEKYPNTFSPNSHTNKKVGDFQINHFNLIENKNMNNNHNKNRSRNKIDQNNSLFYKKSSLLNLSGGYISYEVNQGNSKEKNDVNEKINSSILLNNIHIKNEKGNNKFDNYLSFANNSIDEIKSFISIQSYEELIQNIFSQTQELKNKLLLSPNSNLIMNISNEKNKSEIENILLEFQKNIKTLKYNYLCVLIEKHYATTRNEKINIIKNANMQIKRNNFYSFCQNMFNKLKEKLSFENDDSKKKYLNKILEILNNYKTISKFDIKYTKKIYKEENKISHEILDKRFNLINNENSIKEEKSNSIFQILKSNNISSKKIVVTTSVIIPILYGINYLMYFYNNNCK